MQLVLGNVVITIATVLTVIVNGEHRAKRNYYGYDYGYGVEGDFWYAGRILGIILGVSLLLICCCIPCICIAGVWFLGWFGLRQRRQPKASTAPNNVDGNHASSTPQRPIIRHPIRVHESPERRNRSFSNDTANNVIYTAEDRYYTSSAPTGERRPDFYRASQF